MSDYDHTNHSRNYPQASFDSGRSGTGLFWLLFAIAGLGLLVLIGSFAGGPGTVEHPGGAGADPVIVPADPESGASSTGSSTGTLVE